SGRATNNVAPNSPSETATQKPAATTNARATIGRSTSRQTRPGGAPSTVAASRRRGSMLRRAGTTILTTNGIATIACASGMISAVVERSSGGASNARRNPKPTVTADVPNGSIRSTSIVLVARPGRDAIAVDARPPTTSASAVAIAANTSELRNAVHGETKRVLVDALEPRARYEARLQRPPGCSDREASTARGPPRNSVVAPTTPATSTRW